MNDGGESSNSKPLDEIWAKLVPLDLGYSDVDLKLDEMVVFSEVIGSSEKQEWCKITRNSDLCSAMMQNTSSNIVLVNGTVVETEDTCLIKCGSEIVPGHVEDGSLRYIFRVMATEQFSTKKLKIMLDFEHAKCSICLNIWHDVVTGAPCLHNFCNGCFSEWLRRSQEKHSSVLCPQCRAVVQFVGRNHFLHNIEEDILQSDSSLKRPDEELAILDSYAVIKSPLVINVERKTKRKRDLSLPSIESNAADHPCPQCGIGCDRAFCGAYWHSQGVNGIASHPVCGQETLKPISEHTVTRIPTLAHDRNRHEQDITERCIQQTGSTLQSVIREYITKLNNREIDRTRMPLKHAEMITAGTHVCNDCYDKLVSFLLYWFRISIPKYQLPPEASQRENCWYGYACRTQHHSDDHARKRNHVCRPTRGSHM
ncbi:hypothetical protein AgCh_013716 [Apium graveolens]